MPPQEEKELLLGVSSPSSMSFGNVDDLGYEDHAPTISSEDQRRRFVCRRQQSRNSSVKFSTLQKLDLNEQPMLQRRSVYRRESFIVQFAKTKGPPQITFLMMLVAIGVGMTIGVVPAVMSDRFARLNHGYTNPIECSSSLWQEQHLEKPQACFLGSADAQKAVATSNLISSSLTFLTSSMIGSFSDENGRRGILILGLSLTTLSPLMLFLIQIIPTMSPWWYYGCHASSGMVNWMAVALSSLADVLPAKFRAPGIGLLLAGFMLGFSLSPIFAFLLDNLYLSMMSFSVVFCGLLSSIFFLPETLPPQIAEEARQKRRRREEEEEEDDDNEHQYHDNCSGNSPQQSSWIRMMIVWRKKIVKFITRPAREMSILNRNSFFRLISLLAFFSGMVSSGDQLLLVYYVEERLGFTAQDVSIMFLIMGIMGLCAQGILLKPLNDCVGEKMVVAICFFLGAVDNTMYGLARNKFTIYMAVVLASLTGMAFPTISAIKANNVDESEQGRIQGALYSLQALASGIGPVLLRFVYSKSSNSPLGPGAMFVFAGGLYLVAVAAACALPTDMANSKKERYDDYDDDDDSYGNSDIIDIEESTDISDTGHGNDDDENDSSAAATIAAENCDVKGQSSYGTIS